MKGIVIRRRAPSRRKRATSAVASSTACGVLATEMPESCISYSVRSINFGGGERLTLGSTCAYVNVVVSSTVVADVLQAVR